MQSGVIVTINQWAVEVEFRPGAVPQLFETLLIPEIKITLEVLQQLGRGLVRAIALGPVDSMRRGMSVVRLGAPLSVPVGAALLGRIVNGLGDPIDDLGPVASSERCQVRRRPGAAREHGGTTEIVETGVKGIDLLCPIIKGGAAGLFGSPIAGGASDLINTLLLYLSRDDATYSVYAGVGASTREVSDLHHALRDENAFDRVTMVVASAGESCVNRIHACLSALTMAERLRDDGADVLLCLNDVWQYVEAMREIAALLHHTPSHGLLPPTLFEQLESMAERSCSTEQGFMTSLYATSLSENESHDEFIVMSATVLDTIIVFSDRYAEMGMHPAIDWTRSISRNMNETALDREHYDVARAVREMLRRIDELENSSPSFGLYEYSGVAEEILVDLSRGRKLRYFLTQPLFAQNAGRLHVDSKYIVEGPGKCVPLRDTIAGCRAIVDGLCDHMPELSFHFSGSIEDAQAKQQLIENASRRNEQGSGSYLEISWK